VKRFLKAVKWGLGVSIVGGLLMLLVFPGLFRHRVPPGSHMCLRYKGALFFSADNKPAKPGHWAAQGEVGPIREPLGPGDYWLQYLSPWWEVRIEKSLLVDTGEIASVTHLLGDPPPNGAVIAEGTLDTVQHKGQVREPLKPGLWRINSFGFTAEKTTTKNDTIQTSSGAVSSRSGWVEVPPGSILVVNNKHPDPSRGLAQGLQKDTRPPGITILNPSTQSGTVMEVGYWAMTRRTKLKKDEQGNVVYDDNGEPIIIDDGQSLNGGIPIICKDSQKVWVDFTLIWGFLPDSAEKVLKSIGTRAQIENVIWKKVDSIFGTRGSGNVSADYGQSAKRTEYEKAAEEEVTKTLSEMGLVVYSAKVVKIHIPVAVRKPLQMASLAKEKTLTAQQIEKMAKAKALYEKALQDVGLGKETTAKETLLLVKQSQETATADAAVKEEQAKTLAAQIEKDATIKEAEALKVLEKAKADGKALEENAKGELYELAVKAFNRPEDYGAYRFVEELSDRFKINLFYAGWGTWWTDLDKLNIQIPAPKKTETQGNPKSPD
jgi:hypothetical protein